MFYKDFMDAKNIAPIFKNAVKKEIETIIQASQVDDSFFNACKVEIHEGTINDELRFKLEWENPIEEDSIYWLGAEILSDDGYGCFHIWKEIVE